MMPPRDPNNDDDEDEDADAEDRDDEEPPIVREPDDGSREKAYSGLMERCTLFLGEAERCSPRALALWKPRQGN
jgi:hypothetical protein